MSRRCRWSPGSGFMMPFLDAADGRSVDVDSFSLGAACKALLHAPGYQATHDALLATLPAINELQRRLNRALQGDLPHALRRRRQPLAIDLHLVPYHGSHLHDADEVYRGQAKSG